MDQQVTIKPDDARFNTRAGQAKLNPVAVAREAHHALMATVDPAEIRNIEARLDAAENLMRATGLYPIEEMRPINEERMRARWCLGQALASFVRGTPFPGSATMSATQTRFRDYLKQIALDKTIAHEAQRIAALPNDVLAKTFEQWRRRDDLLHYADLIEIARPYWTLEKRKETHRRIAARASTAKIAAPEQFGPFALIYADPPWLFETYSDMATRLADEHYPTLTDQEIIDFRIHDRSIPDISGENCALFLWCTSSNLERAFAVMRGWGFTYKSQAVWDKERTGTGLIFLNQHEVLLYGSKGSPPKPLYLPPSVFRYLRGEHSAKPPEIRTAIEQMYPAYGEDIPPLKLHSWVMMLVTVFNVIERCAVAIPVRVRG
jgi:N6-adenosine-specific RNA methylase IME4